MRTKRVQFYKDPKEWEAVRQHFHRLDPDINWRDPLMMRKIYVAGCKALGIKLPKPAQ